MNDPFDPAHLNVDPAGALPGGAPVPAKIQKRRQHFVTVPYSWIERLAEPRGEPPVGASGKTYHVALHLLYLHWKGNGQPIKLANGMLEYDGVSRQSKWRALADLEHRGLIRVERRPSRSPIVSLLLV
jgi:hypothetical protein